MQEHVFSNCRLVLADEVIEGSLVVRDGRIAAIDSAPSGAAGAVDMEGDLLIPGLVELHTDNLERHLLPRPKAHWPAIAAVIAHDSQIASSGITTVFDAMAIGDIQSGSMRKKRLEDMTAALREAKEHGVLKADHILHLRCEISDPAMQDMLEPLLPSPDLGLLSVMDHTPGQRQFVSEHTYRNYYQAKFNLTDSEMESFITARREDQKRHSRPNRRFVVEQARQRNLHLASHDDATLEHVREAVEDGMTIAEFPTTVDAAKASHEAGLAVMMGGPNLVRGGSHSGNVSARDLAEHGVLDVISSDYAPASLLHGAMLLAEGVAGYDLPRAIATVTRNPARAAGLDDRGEIALGKKADLVRVWGSALHPIITGVWRNGERVA